MNTSSPVLEKSEEVTREESGPHRVREFLLRHAPVASISLILLLVIIGFTIANEQFLTSTNLLNVVRQSAPVLIVAVAMTLVIAAKGIDLSVGSVVAFTGTTAALLMSNGVDVTLAVGLVFLIGAIIGGFNGYFIAFQRLPAFIVTLASLSIFLGAAQLEAKGFSIPIEGDSWLVTVGQDSVLGVPIPALIAVISAILGWLLLTRTPYGIHLQGIGSNQEAVRRAGIRVERVVASVYMISGFAAAVAGLLIVARLQSGSATVASGLELQVIAAVVLGGTSLFGGRATMVGTVLGVLTIALISNGLLLMRVEPFYVLMVQGLILLLAVAVNERVFARWVRSTGA